MAESWKTIHIFISSTFRDMHTERDHLVRFVFPELKERCRKLRVQLIDVDLRWGVTEEDANAGKALDICLDEIDACRPYFLGLLGFRYGYVPAGHQHSITAQEIFHGVLHTDLPKQVVDLRKILEGKLEGQTLSNEETNCLIRCYPWDVDKRKYVLTADISGAEQPILRSVFQRYSIYQKDRSYFFFRSEALTRQLAADHPEDFFEKDPQRLVELKDEIRGSGLPVFEYNDLESFGQLVRDVLWARIESEAAAPVAEKDWLEQEAEFHELFMADRTRRFVGRRELLDRMHAFAERKDEPSLLLMTGQPGCGKSALMSRFTEEVIHKQPDWLILSHFVGASAASTNLRRMLRRFCTQLNRTVGSLEEAPEDINELLKLFPELLAKAPVTRKVLFIIDAVNQLEKIDDAHRMNWLPRRLPPNARFVISTLEGEAQDALLSRYPQEEKLHGLLPLEIRELVKAYLEEIRHEFPNRPVEAEFFAKVERGNPLYILVALEELRIFGKFEELGTKISKLPNNIPDLFDQVLERIEADFNPALVRECMSYIAGGRHGMTADELQSLLKEHAPGLDPKAEAVKLPDLLWSRLYRSFSYYLFERSGVIDFFHGQLKEAAGKRYLSKEADRNTSHKMIAEYFEKRWQEPYLRALDELPHQLAKAEDWNGLKRVLCDLSFIGAKCAAAMTFDLVADYNMATKQIPDDDRAQLEEFARFIRSESHILSVYPEATFQQAANQPDNTALTIAAIQSWESGAERRPWIQWINKPQQQHRSMMTLAGHSNNVLACAYSPDGGRIVSASEDRTLKVWDAETGEVIMTLAGHDYPVNACAFSPDGRRIVSCSGANDYDYLSSPHGSYDPKPGELKVWNAETGVEIATLVGHKNYVNACAYSPDGRRIVSASDDKTLKVWDAETGSELTTLNGHSHWIKACAYSPDGKWIVSAAWDQTLKVWDVKTEEQILTLASQGYSANTCAYSPDARRILSASHGQDGLKVWDAGTGQEIMTLTGHTATYSPDGTRIVSASWDKVILYDAETGVEIITLVGHQELVNACAYSPDGRKIVSVSNDKTLKIWDANTDGEAGTLTANPVQVLETYAALAKYGIKIRASAYSPDGSRVSLAYMNSLKVRDTQTGEQITILEGHKDNVNGCAYSPDGKQISSCSDDKTLKMWDVETGGEVTTLTGHTSQVKVCAYSPDGKRIVSAASWEKLKVWDVETKKEVLTLAGFTNGIKACAYSPDGRRVVAASGFALKLSDSETGKEITTLAGHTSWVDFCDYFPDGRRIVSKSRKEIKVWDANTGAHIATLSGNTAEIEACAISPDGLWVISGSEDRMLRIWDAKTGVEVHKLFLGDLVLSMAPVPGGRYVLIGNGTIYMLRLAGVEFAAPILTPIYLYRFDNKSWDSEPTAKCEWCALRFVVPSSVLDAIRTMNEKRKSSNPLGSFRRTVSNAIRRIHESPCATLSAEAWNDPRLVSECPLCHKQVRFNPFIVDNRHR